MYLSFLFFSSSSSLSRGMVFLVERVCRQDCAAMIGSFITGASVCYVRIFEEVNSIIIVCVIHFCNINWSPVIIVIILKILGKDE